MKKFIKRILNVKFIEYLLTGIAMFCFSFYFGFKCLPYLDLLTDEAFVFFDFWLCIGIAVANLNVFFQETFWAKKKQKAADKKKDPRD